MRAKEFIIEAINYDEMFSLINGVTGIYKRDIDSAIQYGRTKLKKNDRIVWYLKKVRCGIIRELLRSPDMVSDEPRIRKIADRLKTMYEKDNCGDSTYSLGVIWNTLEHYLSIPYDPMNQVVFTNKTAKEIFDEFEDLENEWREFSKEAVEIEEGDEILIDFGMVSGRNYSWWLLPRESCRSEGSAMGHCGNTASPRGGQRILSLRSQTDKMKKMDLWKPHLTFILNADGTLGEMKGRGNNKPNEKYHPMIVKLLLNDIITGVSGGGYAPEQNFSLTDLSDDNLEKLLFKKPQLAEGNLAVMAWLYKRGKLSFDSLKDHIVENSKNYIGYKVNFDEKKKQFVIDRTFDVSDIDDGADTLKQYSNVFSEGYMEVNFDLSDYDYDNLVDAMNPEQISRLKKWIEDTADPETEQDLWDEFDEIFESKSISGSDIYEWASENGADEVESAMQAAVYTGYESGTYDQLHKAAMDSIASVGLSTDNTDDIFGSSEGFPDEFKIILTLDEYVGISNNVSDAEYGVSIKAESDLNEPYYGFNEFSESAAVDRLLDEMP